MSELRVLNAYAGIGGNRHLWPAEWHVTAVEINPLVAAEYARGATRRTRCSSRMRTSS